MLKDVELSIWVPTDSRSRIPTGDFNRGNECLSYHYRFYVRELDAGPFRKAGVLLHLPGMAPPVPTVDVALDVVHLVKEFQFEEYCRLPLSHRKVVALNTLHSGLLELAAHFRWPTGPLERARAGVEADGYVLRKMLRFRRRSPDRNRFASVEYYFHEEGMDIDLILSDRWGAEVWRGHACRLSPYVVAYDFPFKDVRWVDDHTVRLTSRLCSSEWIVRVPRAL